MDPSVTKTYEETDLSLLFLLSSLQTCVSKELRSCQVPNLLAKQSSPWATAASKAERKLAGQTMTMTHQGLADMLARIFKKYMQERRDLPWPKQLTVLDRACCDILNRTKINAFTQKVSEMFHTTAYSYSTFFGNKNGNRFSLLQVTVNQLDSADENHEDLVSQGLI